MKKKIIISIILLIQILFVTNTCLGFSVDMDLNKKTIQKNDEIIYTINLSEKVIGASFKINYDNTNLELVKSETTNLNVSNNNGKIACVYFNITKTGIKKLQIKFKAINNIKKDLKFTLEEAKFVTLKDEKSYSDTEISGITKTIQIVNQASNTENNKNSNNSSVNLNNEKNQSNKVSLNTNEKEKVNSKTDNTTSKKSIPYTGIGYEKYIIISLIFIVLLYCGLFKLVSKIKI